MTKFKFDKYYEVIIKMKSENKTNKEILEFIGDDNLTLVKLYKILHRLNISNKRYNEKFRKLDEKAIELINSGISHRETAKILGIDQQSMSLRLRTYFNICPLPDGKKEVNSNIFSIIDTEEKAYWLGMMYADGYVKSGEGIELTLKDREHIEKFKLFLASKHKIGEKHVMTDSGMKTYYRLSVKDRIIANDLERLGCYQAKSLILRFPTKNQVPHALLRHFIRGYVDGDGTIGVSGKEKDKQQYLSIIGTKEFIDKYVAYMESELDITFSSSYGRCGEAYSKDISGNIKAKKAIKHLYENSNIYLDRKYDKYTKFADLGRDA